MSDKNNPFDDYGFKNDQIVDCVEKIIDQIWSRLHEDDIKNIETKELLEIIAVLNNSWALVESMINFHEDIYGGSNPLSDSKISDDEEDDDEDDDEDDEDVSSR